LVLPNAEGRGGVLVKYLLFCLGAGCIQVPTLQLINAAESGRTLYTSEMFLEPKNRRIAMSILTALWLAEIALGIALVSWWAGLLAWAPAVAVATFIRGILSHGTVALIGVVLVIGASIALLL
jgi:hypothetical protein